MVRTGILLQNNQGSIEVCLGVVEPAFEYQDPTQLSVTSAGAWTVLAPGTFAYTQGVASRLLGLGVATELKVTIPKESIAYCDRRTIRVGQCRRPCNGLLCNGLGLFGLPCVQELRCTLPDWLHLADHRLS